MINQEKVWDAVAKRWQEYRTKPFKTVIDFIKNQKGKILDIGCGSGRNFTKTKGTIYAVDFSQKMLKYAKDYAKKKKFRVITTKASAENLPFKDNFFDRAIFIATLHCIESEEKRIDALRELHRVLKPGTEAIITVWNKDQPRFKKSRKEVMLSWDIDGKKYLRYYYLYDKEEIKEQVEGVGLNIIKIMDKNNPEDKYSMRNIILVVRKIL